MKKLFLTLFLFVAITFQSLACSCSVWYPFCHSISMQPSDLIVSGIITSFDATDTLSMRLRILHRFKGQENRDTITIWTGTGDFGCPPGWTSMAVHHIGNIGDTVIISLPRIESTTIQNTWEVPGDYRRPAWLCYQNTLKIENGIVSGLIYGPDIFGPGGHVWAMSYPDFLSGWSNNQFACVLSAKPELQESPLLLSPNPAQNKVTIQLPSGAQVFGNRKLFLGDITGKEIHSHTFSGEKTEIATGSLPQGLYLVTVSNEQGQIWQQKLVVQR